MTQNITRKMVVNDIPAVVAVHELAFRGFFLEQMGPLFLKTYYRLTLSYSQSIAFVYVGKSGSIDGFVVGFVNSKAFYERLKKSKLKFVLPTVLGLMANPKLLGDIFRNISRVFDSEHGARNPLFGEDFAELSSIAVVKGNSGIGSLLLERFLQDAWSRDVSHVVLTTDLHSNDEAHNFYKKFGFEKNHVETRKRRQLCHYILAGPES